MTPVKIYVGNLTTAARSCDLKELFEKFGRVVECDILKDFGFVHMENLNDAKAAIAGLNDTVWKGSRVRVELSTTRTQKGEPSERSLNRPSSILRNRRSTNRPRYNGAGPSRRDLPPPSGYDGPPPRYHHDTRHYYSNTGGGGGPIRDSRYDRPVERHSSRPYPDIYDRNSRGLPPSRDYSSNNYDYRSQPLYRNETDMYRREPPSDYFQPPEYLR